MAYQVEWSPRAIEDVEAIALYDGTRNLSRFPLSGRVGSFPLTASNRFSLKGSHLTAGYLLVCQLWASSGKQDDSNKIQ